MSELPSICVYPLSTPYSLLPRTHTYALVLALLIPLPRGWLFRAALAAFTTKTSIFAIDAVVHMARLRKQNGDKELLLQALPLDLVPCLEMLSLASLVALWLLVVSRNASVSAARGLVRVWVVAVAIGCIVAFAALRRVAKTAAGTGLDRFDMMNQREDDVCPDHAVFMPVRDILGDNVKRLAIGTYPERLGSLIMGRVGITGLVVSALTLCCIGASGPGSKRTVAGPAAGWAGSPWDVEGGHLGHSTAPEVVKEKSFARTGLQRLSWVARYGLMVAVPALLTLVAVTTEKFLLDTVEDVPEAEPLSSVGQWGIWAATGVVVFGTFVNAVRENTTGTGASGTPPQPVHVTERDNAFIGVPDRVYDRNGVLKL